MTVPRAALAAALAAVPFVNGDACRRILEAAAPHLQGTGPVLQGFERDLTEAEAEALRERFREAQRNGRITVLADDTGERIAEAVAAERERCAQLAETEAAQRGSIVAEDALRAFASRLREQP